MPNKRDDMIIVGLLKEVRQDQKEHSIILSDLKHDVATNTKDLSAHIEGVKQNRTRIEKLEEPRKAFSIIKDYLFAAAAIS